MKNKFFRFNNILVITAVREEYNGQNKVLHKRPEERRRLIKVRETRLAHSPVHPLICRAPRRNEPYQPRDQPRDQPPREAGRFDDSISKAYAHRAAR